MQWFLPNVIDNWAVDNLWNNREREDGMNEIAAVEMK